MDVSNAGDLWRGVGGWARYGWNSRRDPVERNSWHSLLNSALFRYLSASVSAGRYLIRFWNDCRISRVLDDQQYRNIGILRETNNSMSQYHCIIICITKTLILVQAWCNTDTTRERVPIVITARVILGYSKHIHTTAPRM